MAKIIDLGGKVLQIGYAIDDELASVQLPYPKDWEGKFSKEELAKRIAGYQESKYAKFFKNFNENLTAIFNKLPNEGDLVDYVPQITEDIKKLISWMYTQYPQFSKYKLQVAAMCAAGFQISLYHIASDELLIVDTVNKAFQINSIVLTREFMGEDRNLPINQFITKLNFGV